MNGPRSTPPLWLAAYAVSSWAIPLGRLEFAFLAGSIVCTTSLVPRSVGLGRNLRRIADAPERTLYLTFDDGPDPETTPGVLARLERFGMQATFFPIGTRAERHPAYVDQIIEAGHRLANHTWSHPNGFWFLPPAKLVAEIDRASKWFEKRYGNAPTIFRAPAGIRPPWLEHFLEERGMTLVSWTRRGFDTVRKDADKIADRLFAARAPGAILLLHDGSGRKIEGDHIVLPVLDRLLPRLAKDGWKSVALPGAIG